MSYSSNLDVRLGQVKFQLWISPSPSPTKSLNSVHQNSLRTVFMIVHMKPIFEYLSN